MRNGVVAIVLTMISQLTLSSFVLHVSVQTAANLLCGVCQGSDEI